MAERGASLRRAALWVLASGYLAGSYLTLEQAPEIWRVLNQAIGGRGGDAMVALYGVVGLVAVFLVARAGRPSPKALIVTVGLAGLFAILYAMERGPAEKFHMFQYGVFGALLYLALRVDLDPGGRWLYAIGAAIGVAAGLVDELIQRELATRVFTLHDVFVNGASASAVLVFLRVHQPARATLRHLS